MCLLLRLTFGRIARRNRVARLTRPETLLSFPPVLADGRLAGRISVVANVLEPPDRGAGSSRSRASRKGDLRGLRVTIFLALLVAFGLWGWSLYSDTKVPADRLQTPQIIQVYVSDPQATVDLKSVIAEPASQARSLEFLYWSIAAPAGTDWVLVSELHQMSCRSGPARITSVRFGVNASAPGIKAWVCMGRTGSASTPASSPTSIGSLDSLDPQAAALTEGLTEVAYTGIQPVWRAPPGTGVLFAHLPALAEEPPPQPYPSLILDGVLPHGAGQSSYALDEGPQLRPHAVKAGIVQSYQALPGTTGPAKVPYYVPATVSTQAILQLRRQSQLVNYRVDQIDPTDGAFQDGNFLWSGTGYIEPTAYLSNPASDNSRANDGFIAGVALAVAATAFIALVQEVRRRDADGGVRPTATADATAPDAIAGAGPAHND